MSAPVTTTFGWCQTHGTPDSFHDLCPGEYVSQVGVLHVCPCIRHEGDPA